MSDLTRPERAAARRQAKRYKAAIDKRGLCSACKHREVTLGRFHCRNKEERSYGACEFDGRTPKFEFDPECLNQFKDAA